MNIGTLLFGFFLFLYVGTLGNFSFHLIILTLTFFINLLFLILTHHLYMSFIYIFLFFQFIKIYKISYKGVLLLYHHYQTKI